MLTDNELKIRAFFTDLYPFAIKYGFIPVGMERSDTFWKNLLQDADELTAKHRWKNDMLPVLMVMDIVRHAEDQAERREFLCDRGNTPIAAFMEQMAKKEVLKCHDTNEPDSTCG